MTDHPILLHPIGTISSPFHDLAGTPIQPRAALGVKGQVILDPSYKDGLMDLEGFSHIILIYYFHRSGEGDLIVKPFLDDQKHGVFATRAPRRPNSIGISVVKLIRIQGNILEVENVDILDDTPLLDIKPYIPDFDHTEDVRIGWLENRKDKIPGKQADERFI